MTTDNKRKIRRILLWLAAALAAALLLEVLVFNFRWIQTRGYQPYAAPYTVSESLTLQENGRYRYTEGDAFIEMKDLGRRVKNLYLGVCYTAVKPLTVTVRMTDDAHSEYFNLPDRQTIRTEKKSLYLPLQTAGASDKIQIRLRPDKNAELEITGIRINAPVPFDFSLPRCLLVFLALLLLALLRPSSPLYTLSFSINSGKQLAVTLLLAAVNIGVFATIASANPNYTAVRWKHHYQYQMLAEAFADGQTYLKEEPPAELAAIDNPYNPDDRNAALKGTGKSYLWDAAYYDGHYYVYFGVVPVLLFYLPYYLLTGSGFPTYIGVFLSGAALLLGVLFLLRQIVRRWFAQTPFLVYLLVGFVFANGCGGLFMMADASFYSLPIILAMALSVWGLCLWLMALNRLAPPRGELGETARAPGARRVGPLLAGGSLCMALVAGCRPQLLLGSLLAVPLFWSQVRGERTLFSRSSWKRTLLFCLPFAVVAAGLMAYNAARFGSPFDFGANYNLTTNDMVSRGFRAGRIPLGLYKFFLQPPSLGANFPFVEAVPFSTGYMGQTITEAMYGGVFACCPFLLAWAAAGHLRAPLKEKRLWTTVLLCGLSSLIIVVADTQMAGILPRYQNDFAWLLFLGAALLVFTLYETIRTDRGRKTFYLFLAASCALTVLFHLLVGLTSRNNLSGCWPELYYRIKHLVQFWL